MNAKETFKSVFEGAYLYSKPKGYEVMITNGRLDTNRRSIPLEDRKSLRDEFKGMKIIWNRAKENRSFDNKHGSIEEKYSALVKAIYRNGYSLRDIGLGREFNFTAYFGGNYTCKVY